MTQEILHGAVLVRDGLIADISPGREAAGEDLNGDYLMPGVVELHTDHLEYHASPAARRALGSAARRPRPRCAAGGRRRDHGVRRGAGRPRGGRPARAAPAAGRRLADSIELAADADLLRADHAIHVRCEVSAEHCLDEFRWFADDPHVRLVSLMDHTPGQRQYADLEAFKRC